MRLGERAHHTSTHACEPPRRALARMRCAAGGNYNPHTARCTCPIGRNGSFCEQPALPACRIRRTSTAVACTVRRPQHCECVRQCLASGAFAAHIYPVCFERANYEPFSELPALASTRATFYQLDRRSLKRVKQLSATQALGVEYREQQLVYVPHRHCPMRCSERGACIANRAVATSRSEPLENVATCQCDGFYTGRTCEKHVPTLCYNNCSGRGVCLDGFCSCEPPYFGPACAYGGSPTRAAVRGRRDPSHPLHFSIHVPDLDAVVLRRHQMGSDPDPIFNTHHRFVARLLEDPPALAASADDADLVLAPAFGTNMDGLLEYYEHAASALERHAPSAWRARDIVWFTSGDGGGCDLNRLPRLRGAIIAAHYLKLNVSQACEPTGASTRTHRSLSFPRCDSAPTHGSPSGRSALAGCDRATHRLACPPIAPPLPYPSAIGHPLHAPDVLRVAPRCLP